MLRNLKAKKLISLLLCAIMLIGMLSLSAIATPLIAVPHIVGNETLPVENQVSDFTVGTVDDGDYIAPRYDFWENGRNTFIFVTGDPAYEALHGQPRHVDYRDRDGDLVWSGNATVHYIARQDVAGVGGGAGAPSVPLTNVSPFVRNNPGTAPIPVGFNSNPITFVSNTVYFFDDGAFLDTDDFSVNNKLNVENVAFIGLNRDDVTDEPLAIFYKSPAGPSRGGNNATGFMARNVINEPNIHIENIIFDGSNIDMVRQGGTLGGQNQASRGEFFWMISNRANDLVVRDVVLQNIGNRVTLPTLENLTANNQRKNVAINIFAAGAPHIPFTAESQRNFENLTIRNVSTMTGFGVIQMNRTSGNYFYNLNMENPNASGTGFAHSATSTAGFGTSVIKIEHTPIGAATVTEGGNTVTGDQIAEQMGNIVFAGMLRVPENHVTSAIYVQDFRYSNILMPNDFNWALVRTSNGNSNLAAVAIYNSKRPQATNYALLQLDKGYWVVENQTAAPNLQAQLDNIGTILGTTATSPASMTSLPAPNIKMIADTSGQIGNFTIPEFPQSRGAVNIVALRQTATPTIDVHPARANALGFDTPAVAPEEFVAFNGDVGGIVLPANNETIRMFNFDFKTLVEWTIEDVVEGDPAAEPVPISPGIVNFTSLNSGRNLFLQHVPESRSVTYTVEGLAPANFSPALSTLDSNEQIGNLVAVGSDLTTTSTDNGGVAGTWTFNGWTTANAGVTIADGMFVMPENAVVFVGTWTFTMQEPGDGNDDNGDDDDYDDNGNNGNGPFAPYHNSFMIGRPSGNIYPHANIRRSEVAAVFFRLLSDDTRIEMWSQQNQFPDVNSPQWFNNEVSTITNMGLIRGLPNGTFEPNRAITRAEVAAIVARFFGEPDVNVMAFTDIAGHWAEAYINQLAHFGWVQGSGDGTFRPNDPVTRAEFAAIICRMLDRVPDSVEALLDGRTRWPDKSNQNAWYYLYLQEATHSTEFERLENDYVRWTAILDHIDWSVFSRPNSRPDDILISEVR